MTVAIDELRIPAPDRIEPISGLIRIEVTSDRTVVDTVEFSLDEYPNDLGDANTGSISTAIVFLPRWTTSASIPVVHLRNELNQHGISRIVFVTGLNDHFERTGRSTAEALQSEFGNHGEVDVIVARLGCVLPRLEPDNDSPDSMPPGLLPDSWTGSELTRQTWKAPFLKGLHCGFVTPEAAETFLRGLLPPSAHAGTVTLLGQNRCRCEVLKESRTSHSVWSRVNNFTMDLLAVCGFRFVTRLIYRCGSMFLPAWRAESFETIVPDSEDELLSLCCNSNRQHVAVCGYNNGVNHFGWRHPGRTVVPTFRAGAKIEVCGDRLITDAGVTLKQCLDVLDAAECEFFVVPNYSYIAMGTVFFVPVHGSGSEVSTLGDTIERVRLFDPTTSTVVEVSREDPLFRETMYNRQSPLVVLGLELRIRPRASYVVRESTLCEPTAANLMAVFSDPNSSNIEIRKSRASDSAVHVSRYYRITDERAIDPLAVPRDRLGQLWDRLEENRVSAWLFHTLIRRLAFHVELFLTADEFTVFWQHHQSLPVSKLQLRFARRDDMPHSPFADADRISVDLFMWKKHREPFMTFIRQHLPHARFNPGKQSA
ncbi:MAG: hypothetical protein KDA81_03625 [Planctomycetaceae bacterium]|nr:hypothetical protein [Planctomycetaceae bacterium]